MIEQMQENMEEFNRLSSDSLTAQSAMLLRQLMAIDVESLSSSPLCATRVSVQEVAVERIAQGNAAPSSVEQKVERSRQQ